MLQQKLAQTWRKVAAAANLRFVFPTFFTPTPKLLLHAVLSIAYLQVGKTGFQRVLKLLTQTGFNKFKLINTESKTIKDNKYSLKEAAGQLNKATSFYTVRIEILIKEPYNLHIYFLNTDEHLHHSQARYHTGCSCSNAGWEYSG